MQLNKEKQIYTFSSKDKITPIFEEILDPPIIQVIGFFLVFIIIFIAFISLTSSGPAYECFMYFVIF